MEFSLLLLFLMVAVLVGSIIYTSSKNKETDIYIKLDTEEWNCPECGFHVQAGSKCIYCDTKKPI